MLLPHSHPTPTCRVAITCMALLILLSSGSCEKKSPTLDWSKQLPPIAPIQASPPQRPRSKKLPPPRPISPPMPHGEGIRFITYNLKNWLSMDRKLNDLADIAEPKPESEKSAVVQLLNHYQPDILGICEIGTPADLLDLQNRLKSAGLNLPYSYHTGGTDPERYLAILSKFPIQKTRPFTHLNYRINGKTRGYNRGILDATITISKEQSLRFIGTHLKSKRQIEEEDQEQMRLHEAQIFRNYLDQIFANSPSDHFVIYGDFNDTYPSPTLQTITHGNSSETSLIPIYAKDHNGEAWTHHWSQHDIYSRIDYVMTLPKLKRSINDSESIIISDPITTDASDHRPILIQFR